MILVSACLAGVPCRMDGASRPVEAVKSLVGRGEAVLICPEVLGGLSTPRSPSERQPDGRVVNKLGQDVTEAYRLGAEKALEICRRAGCTCAILKARSPSCGKGQIYDGSFTRTLVPGNGVCAELLQQAGIPVFTEEEYLALLKETENIENKIGCSNMNQNIVKRNTLLAQKVIKGLQSRNMSGYWAESREEALRIALELIPEGSSVSMGGAMSAHEIGLVEAVKSGNYRFIDRDAMTDKRAAMLAGYDADVFLSSCNAITEDGVLVNIDGNANRVSAIAQGPRKIVMIVGMNKVCPDVDTAMKRARNVAAPINAQRFGLSTPCAKTGACMNCKSPDTICCQFLVTRYSRHTDRIHVILVNDSLGF